MTRTFERAVGNLTALNPITGNADKLTNYLADPVEMNLLHMIAADPARTPTFTLFANPDYFLFTGAANCNSPCVTEQPGFAWNHGDVAPDINTTWLGMVGPGVKPVGVDNSTWSDHTDTRPTMMALMGLTNDYSHDGRVLAEELLGFVLPKSLKKGGMFLLLARAYKQINAPVGPLGLASLRASTLALESGNAADYSTYANIENQLISITSERKAPAKQMIALLEGAAFDGQDIDEDQATQLIAEAQALLDEVNNLP